MPEILGIDLETASGCDLKTHGAWAYSLHDSTEVYCVSFGFAECKGGYRYVRWEPGQPFPGDVAQWITELRPVLAHNVAFELAIWSNVLRGQVPPILDSQWVDTQPLGLAVNLPASLDGLAHALGCPTQKDKDGAKLMRAMANLSYDERLAVWFSELDTDENRLRLADYCEADVGAMLDCWYRLPKLSVAESAVHRVHLDINRRGVYLDRAFAQSCAKLAKERKAELDDETFSLTSGELANSRAAPALKAWLADQWAFLPVATRKKKLPDGTFEIATSETCDKNAVRKLMEDPSIAAEVRQLLANRTEANKVSSLSKLERVPLMIDGSGRTRDALAYCGAHTGRWTSYGLQIHNLAKDKMSDAEGALVRDAIRAEDLGQLKFVVAQPLDAISQSIRSCISAPPGRELIAADYSAIEARVVAWLAGQDDLVELFYEGEDVYIYAANNVGSDNRQLGKVMVLALGYGMGALKFHTTAGQWGVHLDPKDARKFQRAWRVANPMIVQFWGDLENACRDAIKERGTVFRCGRVACAATSQCLFVQLPSGRALRYWHPKITVGGTKTIKTLDEDGALVDFEMRVDEIRYMRPKGAAMMRESVYGGQLVENVTQAVARDLLAEATVRVDAVEPYDLVMHVHDSLAAEVPKGEGDVDEFCELMNASPEWAAGLPLSTEGYRDVRFRG